MKKVLMTTAIATLLQLPAGTAQDIYADIDTMYVNATSGLRLRMKPGMNSPTIKILEYADVVTTTRHADPDNNALRDRIQWIDGQWLRVRHEGVAGYAFDGFLSALKPFTHENQLCIGCSSLAIPLANYMDGSYSVECIEERIDPTEELYQTAVIREHGISSTTIDGEGWHQVEYTFEGYRLGEVLNLLRAIVVDPGSREEFERSLVFHEDSRGRIERIDIGLFDPGMRLEYYDEGLVVLTLMVIEPEGLTGG